jgi:hypothetical protein
MAYIDTRQANPRKDRRGGRRCPFCCHAFYRLCLAEDRTAVLVFRLAVEAKLSRLSYETP